MSVDLIQGDALEVLKRLPEGTFQCCVTSPPYYGLRDYGVEGQIGLEESPDAYVARLVDVFREVRRVLRDDGTLWLNLGDSYNSIRSQMGPGQAIHNRRMNGKPEPESRRRGWRGLKDKDRLMIPARVALALQEDGWWLRDEIVWHKPRTTPFPANDRTVAAHEMVYLLTKKPRYFFDWAAIEEPASTAGHKVTTGVGKNAEMRDRDAIGGTKRPSDGRVITVRDTRRSRSVWSISPQPFREAHFATMPPTLAEKCVLAGTRPGDMVLDPFGGAGTTALVAQRNGRSATAIELNPEYLDIARRRLGMGTNLQDAMRKLGAAIDDLISTLT